LLGGREKLPMSAEVIFWLASDEVVSQIPVVARMQVSECFSLLDKTKVSDLSRCFPCRSQGLASSQVRRPKKTEPSSDRSTVGSIAA
jgi:hypothetical protein